MPALAPAQWWALGGLCVLIGVDAAAAWFHAATTGTFSWSRFYLFARKQVVVVVGGVFAQVMAKDAPAGLTSLANAAWWTAALGIAVQYVWGDILVKLGLRKVVKNGLPATAPKPVAAPEAPQA